MRTSIDAQKRPQSTSIERQFVRTANGYGSLWEFALLLTIPCDVWVDHAQTTWPGLSRQQSGFRK